ncbi:MAG: hypothetical protein Q8M16_09735, partial [Pirellulaceae bacterium]|nr:hypothetical protein [Pirellulaceae bacterium]
VPTETSAPNHAARSDPPQVVADSPVDVVPPAQLQNPSAWMDRDEPSDFSCDDDRAPELEVAHDDQPNSSATSNEQLPDYYWTWRMFVEGFSSAETAAIRRLTASQVQTHLDQATHNGLLVNPNWRPSNVAPR